MEEEPTSRKQLEQRFQHPGAASSAGVLLRGTDGTGRVAWVVTPLAAEHGWRTVHLDVAPPASRAGSGLAPLLSQLRGLAPQAALDAAARRIERDPEGKLDGWSSRFARLLTHELQTSPPVVIVLDGAHHLDDVAVDALATTDREADPAALAIVLGVPAGNDPRFTSLGLPLLDVAALRVTGLVELTRGRTGRYLSPGVSEAILAHAQDDPSHALEMIVQLDDDQLAGWTALPIPLPAVASWSDPLQAWEPPTRAALLLAALAHTPSRRVVQHAAHLDSLPAGVLDAPEEAGLVRIDDDSVRFPRPLDRSAVVAAAGLADRRRAHGLLATAFAAVAPGSQAAHVHHLAASRSRSADEMLPHHRSLAEAEERGGRPLAAARAWVAAAATTADRTLAGQWIAHAAALARAAGVAAWGDALTTPDREGAPRRLPSTDDGLLRTLHQLTSDAETTAADPRAAARLYAAGAVAALLAGELSAADDAARRASTLAPPGTDAAAAAGITVAVVDTISGRSDDVATRIVHHLTALPQPRQDPDATLVRVAGLLARIWQGDVDGARVDLRALTAALDSAGHVGHLPLVLASLAHADQRRGWWDAAAEHAQHARDLAARTDLPHVSGFAVIALALIAAARGQRERATRLTEDIIAIAAAAGTESMRQYAAAAEGLLELSLGRPDAAIDRLEAADDEARRRGVGRSSVVSCVSDLLLAYLDGGHTTRAEQLVARLEVEAGTTDDPRVHAIVRRGRAMLGPIDEAIAHLEASSAYFGQVVDPFEQARDRALSARVRLQLGDVGGARIDARVARLTFTALRATPWVQQVDQMLVDAERTGTSTLLDGLTPQERRVADLVAVGSTNREIAETLSLSPKTVEYHLNHIYGKLGMSSRGALIRLVLDAGGPAPARKVDPRA